MSLSVPPSVHLHTAEDDNRRGDQVPSRELILGWGRSTEVAFHIGICTKHGEGGGRSCFASMSLGSRPEPGCSPVKKAVFPPSRCRDECHDV